MKIKRILSYVCVMILAFGLGMRYQYISSPSSNISEASNQPTEQVDYAIAGTDSNQSSPSDDADEPDTIIELPPQIVHNVDISYQNADGTMDTISTTVPDDHELTKEEMQQIIDDYNRINNYTSWLAEHPEADTKK
ncbi:MAG: hypothetical protein Q4F95_16355 [Oscillospiraceae bacterium]|nr:hypothetical protein [Oscillospiraceae bacterium]